MGAMTEPAAFEEAGRAADPGFETFRPGKPPGLVRRVGSTIHHFSGLALGGLHASIRRRRAEGTLRGVRSWLERIVAALAWPFLDRRLASRPFPVQLRRRLELLGPTYIKLGQILSLREDILPKPITDELKNLLNRLPVVDFDLVAALVEQDLGRPLDSMFAWVDPVPLGSASIAQTHRATTLQGDAVILKVVKPGIRETLRRDAVLLRLLGRALQTVLARYQPRRVIDEFCDYTLREVDLRREADNAETFQANFRDMPDVLFPRIWREYSGSSVLCMEFLDGVRPDAPEARALPPEERERLIDLGASSIIRMLYRDGFFHADLHPGNLLILPGPKVGFIDLGMVGRFDDELRRTMLYYYYCLVMGDAENAARYLLAVAQPGAGGNPQGFRREVEEISRRWHRASSFEGFSLAQLILESVQRGGQFRMYFPVEMVLMVKALVTFEGVGHILKPGFDVAEVSQSHIRRIFIHQFSPLRLMREGLRGAPDLVDALVKAPTLVTEGIRFLEKTTHRPRDNPFAGIRGTLLAGFCLVAGAILAAMNGPWPIYAVLFGIALILAVRRGS